MVRQLSSNSNHRTNPLQLVANSRPAQVYLAAVAVTGLFVAVSQATHTATMALPELGENGNVAAFAGAIGLSALLNATLLAWLTRPRRNR